MPPLTMCPPSMSPLQPVTTRPAQTTPRPMPVPRAVGFDRPGDEQEEGTPPKSENDVYVAGGRGPKASEVWASLVNLTPKREAAASELTKSFLLKN